MEKIEIKSCPEIIKKDDCFYVRIYQPPPVDAFQCRYECSKIEEVGDGYLLTIKDEEEHVFIFPSPQVKYMDHVIVAEYQNSWYDLTIIENKKEKRFFARKQKDGNLITTKYVAATLKRTDLRGIICTLRGSREGFFHYLSPTTGEATRLGKHIWNNSAFLHKGKNKKPVLSLVGNDKIESIDIKSYRHCYVCVDDDCPPIYAWGIAVKLSNGKERFFYKNHSCIDHLNSFEVIAESSILYNFSKRLYYVIDNRGRNDDLFKISKHIVGELVFPCKKQKEVPEFIEMEDGRKLKATYIPESKAFKIEEL